jgi:hypothetical protein
MIVTSTASRLHPGQVADDPDLELPGRARRRRYSGLNAILVSVVLHVAIGKRSPSRTRAFCARRPTLDGRRDH